MTKRFDGGFPQRASVRWNGERIQLCTADGQVLAEAYTRPCGHWCVRAFSPAGRVSLDVHFGHGEAVVLLSLFMAAELAGKALLEAEATK